APSLCWMRYSPTIVPSSRGGSTGSISSSGTRAQSCSGQVSTVSPNVARHSGQVAMDRRGYRLRLTLSRWRRAPAPRLGRRLRPASRPALAAGLQGEGRMAGAGAVGVAGAREGVHSQLVVARVVEPGGALRPFAVPVDADGAHACRGAIGARLA